MKQSPYRFFLPVCIGLLVLAVVVYFFHPLAPLFLLASLLIQLPLVFIIFKVNMDKGYEDRSYERRLQYKKDGDAAAFLSAEEREASGAGFAYWSRRAKSLSRLTRAEFLCKLERPADAAALLAEVEPSRLDKINRKRFDDVVQTARALNDTAG